MMKSTRELHNEIRDGAGPQVLSGPEFSAPDLAGYLADLLAGHGMTTGGAIRALNLERSYGYQLFNGRRQPTRPVLLRLALLLDLTEEEAQRLLKLSGRPVLYPRSRFDAAVLYGLTHHLGLEGTDELLASLGEARLL